MKQIIIIVFLAIIIVFSCVFMAILLSSELPTDHNSTDSITIDSVEGLPNWQRIDHYGVDTNKRIKGIRNEICY
jgi:uncharacterized protein YpmB